MSSDRDRGDNWNIDQHVSSTLSWERAYTIFRSDRGDFNRHMLPGDRVVIDRMADYPSRLAFWGNFSIFHSTGVALTSLSLEPTEEILLPGTQPHAPP